MRLQTLITSFLSVASAATLGKRAVTPGTLSTVTDFTAPTKATFQIYVPKKLAASPGVIAAVHYCGGTGQAYYTGSPYKTLAEQYGFIVIYPTAPQSCWDVSSKKSLTHEGGGDSNSIANMVKWTIKNYKADTSKIFVTGSSSGAMMTNVLAATYPDLFKAGIVYSGVAAGCFVSSSGGVAAWNSTCAQGTSTATPQAWAQVVKNMYPGFSGTRTRMQVYHGGVDTTLRPQNYQETMKEWAGVFGYDYNKPQSTQTNTPQAGYTKTVWGPSVQGIFAANVGHSVNIRGDDDMKFFAMMDDVVGLVMVQVISNLGGESFNWVVIGRPILVSIAFAIFVPVLCLLALKPTTLLLNRYREAHPMAWFDNFLCKAQTAFVLHTALLVGLVAGATYAGTSNLFAAYIAGATISWWDSELPHPNIDRTISSGPVVHRKKKTPPAGTSEISSNKPSGSGDMQNRRATSSTETTVEASDASRTSNEDQDTSGRAIYQRYYHHAVAKILQPLFFASVGFSIPITRMFRGAIVWKGIVYTMLMVLAKLVCGLWLVRFSIGSGNG
ncbi:LpqC, Poly(3-hydroxybutyrate) depolymerase [Pyrenophora tritici-repentis]|nr:LpqC, Poly(3-hydroxybutyrate) depolymerase [Pyrenophora tritici-repentis]